MALPLLMKPNPRLLYSNKDFMHDMKPYIRVGIASLAVMLIYYFDQSIIIGGHQSPHLKDQRTCIAHHTLDVSILPINGMDRSFIAWNEMSRN